MTKKVDVVLVMPAYNAERTLRDTYKEIPLKYRKNILLVDDGSVDNTIGVAKKLGIKVFEHKNNVGYGGNQKTCYWEALKLNPDVVVMLHPDYQYDASMLPYLIQPVLDGKYDFMFGSRIATKSTALEGGMPRLKYYVNRIVCFIQNILLGVNFTEHFSGYRAYSARLLKTIPFQRFSNDFVFDQEMTISSLSFGFRIGEIPIPTRYHQKQSSIGTLKGIKFVFEGFYSILCFHLSRVGLLADKRFLIVNKKPRLSFTNHTPPLLVILIIIFSFNYLNLSILQNIWIVFQSLILLWLYCRPRYYSFVLLIFSLFIYYLSYNINNLDKGLVNLTGLEFDSLIKRQEMYGNNLGILYKNYFGYRYFRYIEPLFIRYQNNMFSFLNFDLIFNTNKLVHLLVLIPLTIIGIINYSRKNTLLLSIYIIISILVLGAVFPKSVSGLVILLPIINLFILFGLQYLIRLHKHYEK